MSCKQTQIHKTHHGLDLGEAITFPLIVYFVPGYGTSTQMSFCFETPTTIKTSVILGTHNFVCKPLIHMRSKVKF